MRKNTCVFLITVILIMSLIFAIVFYIDRTLKNDVREFVSRINEIIEIEDNDENIYLQCEELIYIWRKKLPQWSYMVHHSMIEKIETGFITFTENVKEGNMGTILSEGEKLKSLLKITSEQDELSLSNIL